ncbi:MAG: bifunctional biotin--[acetyl-CoA-carboxylase] ligase/biotin operon repressor BirA [Pseudomonadota bacterium]|nr:bifunctional biotin--[acetyl-CoA-carboxylase] ligase/biotin operon repressor BirA [Pseudomonadota bacterium]
MINADLMKCLADGLFHSGEALGARLGVTRAAVWKQIQHLTELGVEIESVRGKGYRLVHAQHLLSADRIREHLSELGAAPLGRIDLFVEIDSTNQYLLERSVEAGVHRSACLAELQTAGRGRRGRRWFSPFARNLYLSMGWRFDSGVGALEGLSLAVGVALCRALEPLQIPGLGLKWPNDVLVGMEKAAGILIELSGDVDTVCEVVIGVGINVRMPDSANAEIDQAWVDLETASGLDVDRNWLAARVLCELTRMLEGFSDTGFAGVRDAWHNLHLHGGSPVRVLVGDREVHGVVLGVDAQGGLRLDTPEGERVFKGGEVRLRAIDAAGF